MKQINYKKLILPNIPYVFFVYLFDKVGQAVRLAPGADISAKILNITQGFSAAFENALPSVYPSLRQAGHMRLSAAAAAEKQDFLSNLI